MGRKSRVNLGFRPHPVDNFVDIQYLAGEGSDAANCRRIDPTLGAGRRPCLSRGASTSRLLSDGQTAWPPT